MQNLTDKLVTEIKLFFVAAKKKKAVLGLSGGIDSALTCFLLAKAIGKANVTALILPVNGVTSQKNVGDAKKFAKSLGVKAIVYNISSISKSFEKLPWRQTKTAKGNTYARTRAAVLYNYANSSNCIVAGTGNRTEIALGYFTKYGDGAADFFPIGGLWKTQVFELSKENNIPKEIQGKVPTAELWPGQTDEKEIGLTYPEMDSILALLLDSNVTEEELVRKGYSRSKVSKIINLVEKNRHKAEKPLVIFVK